MREQRRARRFALNLEILEVNGKPAPGARLLDLSTNGARLELPFAARINEQVKFTILLPGLTKPSTLIGLVVKPSKLMGRVVWKKPASPGGWYITGLQFYQNSWELDQWMREQTYTKA
jgi:hypothetical protein